MRRFLCNSVGMERDAVLLRFGRDRLAVYQDRSSSTLYWML